MHAENYNLWIGNTQVTDQNAADITGNGTASYDPSTNTLTLNGFSYSGPGSTYPAGIFYGGNDAFTVVLNGNNTISMTGDSDDQSGFSSSKDVTFTGTGSLNISYDNSGSQTYTYQGLRVPIAKIIVENGTTINVTGKNQSTNSYAIYANTIIINGGTVNATGGTGNNSYGIYAVSTCTINGGTVNTTGGTGNNSYGISTISGCTINGGTVNAIGGTKAIGDVFINTIAGYGWTDTAGTSGKADIEVSNVARECNYLKVQFPKANDPQQPTPAPTPTPTPTPQRQTYDDDDDYEPISRYTLKSSGGLALGADGSLIATITTNDDNDTSFDHFTGLQINGVNQKRDVDYSVRKGSTIITVKNTVLKSLDEGTNYLAVFFDDGDLIIPFDTAILTRSTAKPAPKTGEV